jgi:hypothetical protein
LLAGCGREAAPTAPVAPEARHWPPPEVCDPQSAESTGEKQATIGPDATGISIGFLHSDPAMTDPPKNELGWGFLAVDGEIFAPGDVFAVEGPSPGYTNNSYEVVNRKGGRTLIRLTKGKGDRLLLLQGAKPGVMHSTAFTSGSKVRCAGKTYDLRPDGWYVGAVRARAFSPAASGASPASASK